MIAVTQQTCVVWRPFLKWFALCYQTVVCLSCPFLSVTFVHCSQTVGQIKMKLSVQVGLGPDHIVLDGDPAPPSPKGHSPPTQYSAHVCCSQMAAWIKRPLAMEVGLIPGDFVLDGDPVPLNRRPMFIIVIVISFEHCTMHSRYWFVQVQVVLFGAFCFYKKKV